MAKLHAQSEAFMSNTELPFKSPALRQKHCKKADLMLWVRPTSLDKTLPLHSVVFTPGRSNLTEEPASRGFSSTRDFRNTQLLAKHNSVPFTFPSSRGAPAIPPLLHAQHCLTVPARDSSHLDGTRHNSTPRPQPCSASARDAPTPSFTSRLAGSQPLQACALVPL